MQLLGLPYDPDIPRGVLAEMERAARRLGLSLRTLEALGRDGSLCRAFVSAARRKDAESMVLFARMANPDARVASAPAPAAAARTRIAVA